MVKTGTNLLSEIVFWSIALNTVKLGDKERFDLEQIGVKEPFPVTKLPIYDIKEQF